jgi:hypothetical protein
MTALQSLTPTSGLKAFVRLRITLQSLVPASSLVDDRAAQFIQKATALQLLACVNMGRRSSPIPLHSAHFPRLTSCLT